MHLLFVSPAPGYPAIAGALIMSRDSAGGFVHADVPAGGEHVQGCGCGFMVIIWAGNLSWDP